MLLYRSGIPIAISFKVETRHRSFAYSWAFFLLLLVALVAKMLSLVACAAPVLKVNYFCWLYFFSSEWCERKVLTACLKPRRGKYPWVKTFWPDYSQGSIRQLLFANMSATVMQRLLDAAPAAIFLEVIILQEVIFRKLSDWRWQHFLTQSGVVWQWSGQ